MLFKNDKRYFCFSISSNNLANAGEKMTNNSGTDKAVFENLKEAVRRKQKLKRKR